MPAIERPRPRLLMLAFACRPNQGSEPGMGWNRAVHAAREFDTWVLCDGHRNQQAIEAFCRKHGDVPGLQFVFVKQPAWQRWLWNVPGLFYLAYNLWHRTAFSVGRELHADLHFDLSHQVTYCGYREPGYLWKLSIPFVWGPIGGTHNYPWRFLPLAGLLGGTGELCRSLVNSMQFRWMPRLSQVLATAAFSLAGNSTTRRHFQNAYGVDMPLMPASGIGDEIGEPRTFRGGEKLRILWCGYLHPLKGLPLLLEALRDLPADVPYELKIVGDGPYRASSERLARRLGVAQHIHWTGFIPHREAIQQYRWADALVFTSLRDTFPTVVLEALAAGLPVICLDHLGMGDIVTPQCGLKVPLTTPKEVVFALRQAIVSIAADPSQWEALSRGAVSRSRQYTWSYQGRQFAEIYRRVLGVQQTAEDSREADTLPGEAIEEPVPARSHP